MKYNFLFVFPLISAYKTPFNLESKSRQRLEIVGEACPTNIIPSTNLTLSNLDQYLGRWYALAETPFRDAETYCVQADYTLVDAEEGRIGVDNSDIKQDKKTGIWFRYHLEGQALYIGPTGGNFQVSFVTSKDYPPTKDNYREPWGNYIVLQTDATSSEYTYVTGRETAI